MQAQKKRKGKSKRNYIGFFCGKNHGAKPVKNPWCNLWYAYKPAGPLARKTPYAII